MNRRVVRRVLAAMTLAISVVSTAQALSAKSNLNLANPVSDTTDGIALSFSADGNRSATGRVTVNNGTQVADNRAFCVTFRLSNPGQQGGMVFDLVNTATGNTLALNGAPTATSQVISGSFAAGTKANTSQVFSIAFRLYPSPIPVPGTYTATIVESLTGGSTLPSGPVLDTNTLTVTITVGTLYDVSVMPAGGSFSLGTTSQALNFGILAAGQSLGADILVRTNVGYSLSLASSNLGSLANTADPTARIAYALSSNGAAFSLDPGPAILASGAPATFQGTARYAISITVAAMAGLPAEGAYTDTITVTLSSP